jgi:hypothetical protein
MLGIDASDELGVLQTKEEDADRRSGPLRDCSVGIGCGTALTPGPPGKMCI